MHIPTSCCATEDRGKYLTFVLFLNPLPIVHVGNYFSI